MTTAKLRLPNQNKFVEQFILDDHEPMTPAPGSTAGTIYTDFDPAAVERLRAIASQPARPYQRRPKATTTPPRPSPNTPIAAPTQAKAPAPEPAPKEQPAPRQRKPKTPPTAVLPPPPPVTMADCQGQTQHAKTLFLRQHLASWVAYGREHKLTGPQMASLVGLSYPAWAKNAKRLLEEPELYNVPPTTAVEEPPASTATSNEGDGDQPDTPAEPRPWGNTFPEWEQYRRKNMLSTQAMADNVGIDRAAYLNQLKDYRAKTAKTNQPPATPATSGDVVERKPRPSDNLFEFNCPVTARIAVWNRWHPPHSRVAIITAGGIEHGHTITPATMTTAHTAVCTVMFDKMLLGKQEVDLTHLIPLGLYTNNSPVTGRQYAACPHCRNWNVETVGHATTCPDCGKPL